jgi:hypothetical protein
MPVNKDDLDRYLKSKVEEKKAPPDKSVILLKAIRKKCHQCSNGIKEEVENCPIEDCPLHKHRKD